MQPAVNALCALLVTVLVSPALITTTAAGSLVNYKAHSPSVTEANNTDILWNQINNVQGGSITFVKKIEGKLYFGTQYGKLYTADDYGQEKRIVSPDTINGMTDLLRNGTTWFIGTEEGLYFSNDKLTTWTSVNNPDLASAEIFNIITHNNAVFTATAKGIFTSDDDGENWRKLEITPAGVNAFPSFFIASNGSTLLAANLSDQLPQSPLIFSRDNGTIWQTVKGYFFVGSQSRQPVTVINNTFYVAGLVYDPPNPEGYVSIISSSDGETWSQGTVLKILESYPAISQVTHDTTGRIYVTNNPYRNTSFSTLQTSLVITGHPSETDWKIFYKPERPVTSLSVVDDRLVMGILHEGSLKGYDPDTDAVEDIDAVNSVYASALAGSNGYLQVVAAGAISNPPQNATFNYVDCDSNVYLYSDGNQWIIRNPEKITRGPVDMIGWNTVKDVDSTTEMTVMVTCSGKLFYSEDGGHSSVEIKTGVLPNSAGATVTLFNGNIYAGNQWGIYEVSAFTTDNPVMKEVKKFDDKTGVLKNFLATAKNLYAASMGLGPLISPDGKNWSEINKGLNSATDVQALAYGNNTVFGVGKGVYRLIDGTDTWQNMSGNLNQIVGNSSVSNIAVYKDTLLITVTDYGVLLGFTDGRTDWKKVNTGLHTRRVNRVIMFGSNAILGTMENGFYNGTFTNSHPR